VSESVIVTTLQRERMRRTLAGMHTALTTVARRLSELEEVLAGLQTVDTTLYTGDPPEPVTSPREDVLIGSIEGLPGTITVANYEGGWAHIGDGVLVQETDG